MEDSVVIEKQPINDKGKSYIAYLVLNRPEKSNGLNTDIINQIPNLLTDLDKDPHCRVLVVTGRGKHFCAGADLISTVDSCVM